MQKFIINSLFLIVGFVNFISSQQVRPLPSKTKLKNFSSSKLLMNIFFLIQFKIPSSTFSAVNWVSFVTQAWFHHHLTNRYQSLALTASILLASPFVKCVWSSENFHCLHQLLMHRCLVSHIRNVTMAICKSATSRYAVKTEDSIVSVQVQSEEK